MIKKYNKWFKIIILFLCSVILFLYQRENFLKPNFVDEQDNFVVSKNLINGHKIYTNIFTHHQPGAYLLSALIQNTVKPNSVEMVIKKHRQFIFLWSIIWIIFLSYRFGLHLLIPMLIFEFIKNKYLGNLFLAESLVIFPIIYLVLGFISKKMSLKELFFWGIICGFVGITLAPIWPLILFMVLMVFYNNRTRISNCGVVILGGLIVVLTALPFIDLKGYYENAILINQKYYISIAGGNNIFLSIIKSFTTPILFLKNGLNIPEILIIKYFIVFFIILLIILIRQKQWLKIFLIVTTLSLTNLRNFELEKIHYDGFHLLIWVGLFFAITFYFIPKKWRFVGILPIILLLFINYQKIITPPNYIQDFEIYYSRIFNMSEAIRMTKNNNDRLLAMPDYVLGYWQGDIQPQGRFIFFYKWMTSVDQLKSEQLKNFDKQPEYLIIGNSENLSLSSILSQYINFKYRGSESSEFYIKKDLYKTFSPEKIEKLKYYGLEAI
jgi:hypothetical protein